MTAHPTSETLERYLDGSLSAPELAAFEAELARSPGLRADVDLQRRLDAALRASFTPGPAPLLTTAEAREPAPIKSRFRWTRERTMFAALAAMLLIAVGIQGYMWLSGAGQPDRPTLAQTYLDLVSHGFKPSEQCTTRDKFAKWMESRYSVPLAPVQDRSDVQLVGWSYSNNISSYTGLLLATVEGKPVVVALDSTQNQNAVGAPCRRGPGQAKDINIFTAEIDGISLYEITPLDKPHIIDNLALVKH